MNRIYSNLGLARRAGQLISGEQAVLAAIRRGKVVLLIIAADASPNALTKYRSLAEHRGIRYCIYGEKDRFGEATGQSARVVLGLLDRSFARLIEGQIGESVQK